MRTKKISLFYKVSDSEIFAPDAQALRRKEAWVKETQRTISNVGEIRIIRVTYELFNPEVLQQQRFFNDSIIDYFAIQNGNILMGKVPKIIHDRYRETILSESLGYEVELVNGIERRRTSTKDFTNTQQWNDFFELLRETIFEPQGYEMPNSDEFWKIAEKYGYEKAKKISIDQLQKRIAAKTKTPK